MQPFKTGARARQFTVFIAIYTFLTGSIPLILDQRDSVHLSFPGP
jgi:hypothetical protein